MMPLTGVSKLFSGQSGVCAIKTDGSGVCWGEQSLGVNGTSSVERPTPTALSSAIPTPVVSMSFSSQQIFAVTSVAAQELWCWGWNSQGECGITADTGSTSSARLADLVAGVTQVANGSSHACVLAGTQVSCFGSNSSGRLGDNIAVTTAGGPAIPVTLPGTPVDLVAGSDFTCTRMADSSVYCWGNNSSGQLGDGTVAPTSTTGAPVKVMLPADDAKAIIARDRSACVVRGDDTVWCWGLNSSDMFRTGTTTTTTMTPVQVLTTPVKQVDIGNGFMCVVALADNSVQCWGTNADGQLGIGRTLAAVTPSPTVIVCDPSM
jgi:alpha-tubulin suppressor-like RCC1 family protein